MSDFDYAAIGNEIALNMLVTKRIREPTLNEIQRNSEKNEFSSLPAWMYNAELHPGLPEHFQTVLEIENHCKTSADDTILLPKLPFQVNREILMKILIIPEMNEKKTSLLPQLNELKNGTIVVSGALISGADDYTTEIFINFHKKLLPCCYAQPSEIIFSCPLTPEGRARCYYVVDSKKAHQIEFYSSSEKLLHRCSYQLKCLNGSTKYSSLHSSLTSFQTK